MKEYYNNYSLLSLQQLSVLVFFLINYRHLLFKINTINFLFICSYLLSYLTYIHTFVSYIFILFLQPHSNMYDDIHLEHI